MELLRWSFGLVLWASAVVPAHAQANVETKIEERPQLSLPLACEPHKTCFVQSYVDLDAGPGVSDYACGGATYEGHSGVDFRLLSAAASARGVSVLASADGTVKGVRDGVTDIFVRDNKAEDVKGRECGNGVLIDHGGGWETQYCHMKQGSVGVAKGQAIKRGERLGDVGFSGMADFAHVHLTVRHNGKVIDPFLPDAIGGACQKSANASNLWKPEVAAAFPYKNGEIIGVGFVGEPVNLDALEKDNTAVAALNTTSPALLFYGRFINLLTGDRVRVVINGPGGSLVEELSGPLERNKATYISYAGKKRRDQPWTAGRYEGRVEVVRDGAVVATRLGQVDLKAVP
jgi:Peptidase family M23